jgi:hypothetical protein
MEDPAPLVASPELHLQQRVTDSAGPVADSAGPAQSHESA